MAEQEKPFGTVDIVFLVMIAGLSDVADLITDLVFAVPVVGQAIYLVNAFLISPLVWATIQFWFIMKVGFGAPGLVNLAGGVGNIIGIPGSETLTVIIAIQIANHPKAAAIASAVSPAGVAGTAGKAAAAEGAATTASAEARAAKAAVAAEEAPPKAGATAKAGPVPAEEIFAPPPGPMEKLQAELAETRPLPERGPVTLDEDTNTVDLRRAA